MLSLFLSSLSLTTQQNMAPSTTQVASKFLTLILMFTNKYCLLIQTTTGYFIGTNKDILLTIKIRLFEFQNFLFL